MVSISTDQLEMHRARTDAQRVAIRPISRVWFHLTDKAAFDDCIELSLKWMQPRSQVKLPPQAWRGEDFDVTDVLGANPAKAVRIAAADGILWAARLDWPDPDHPRTWVTELFAERRQGHLSRFGAQLTCVIRGEGPPFETTRPTLVRRIIERLSAEADGWPLTESANKLRRAEVLDFMSLLYDPSRRLPVLAISECADGSTRVSPDRLATRLAGACHVVHLSTEASWQLTYDIGKRMSVFNGAVRLYFPGLTEETEDPYQHPLWLAAQGEGDTFLNEMATRLLPFAFLKASSSDDFPRFAALRDYSLRRLLSQRPVKNELEKLETNIELLKLELNDATDDRDTWKSLALDEQVKRLAADAELERLKVDNAKLEAKAITLQHYLDQRPPSALAEEVEPARSLNSYEDLETWAEDVLGEHIYIHQLALKDCKKNGHHNMLKRIESALLIIRDYVVPAKMLGGVDRRDLAREKLAELGMEDCPCFADKSEAKRSQGYSVQYENETRVLYDHIKYGNSYDNASQIRMYYFWDEQRSRFVIGKMPSHLRNNLTN